MIMTAFIEGFIWSALWILRYPEGDDKFYGNGAKGKPRKDCSSSDLVTWNGLGEQIIDLLKTAGFTKVKTDHHKSKPWNTVITKK